jgi:hypothetical protein
MFTIASFKRYPQSSATRRVSGGFQNNRDFSIGAYQRFDAGRPRASEAFSNSVRVLKRIAAALIERFVAAMLESRRRQRNRRGAQIRDFKIRQTLVEREGRGHAVRVRASESTRENAMRGHGSALRR